MSDSPNGTQPFNGSAENEPEAREGNRSSGAAERIWGDDRYPHKSGPHDIEKRPTSIAMKLNSFLFEASSAPANAGRDFAIDWVAKMIAAMPAANNRKSEMIAAQVVGTVAVPRLRWSPVLRHFLVS